MGLQTKTAALGGAAVQTRRCGDSEVRAQKPASFYPTRQPVASSPVTLGGATTSDVIETQPAPNWGDCDRAPRGCGVLERRQRTVRPAEESGTSCDVSLRVTRASSTATDPAMLLRGTAGSGIALLCPLPLCAPNDRLNGTDKNGDRLAGGPS